MRAEKKPKTLIVDDQVEVRETLRGCLEEAGFEVTEAGDGEEAVSKGREEHFDLVLMDIRMPKMDGITAAKLLLKEKSKPKIIVITGYDPDRSMDEIKTQVLQLRKPVDVQVILELWRAIPKTAV